MIYAGSKHNRIVTVTPAGAKVTARNLYLLCVARDVCKCTQSPESNVRTGVNRLAIRAVFSRDGWHFNSDYSKRRLAA